MTPEVSAWLMIMLAVAGIALVIAWILLPFALFGTKPLLRHLIREVERTNKLLEQQANGGLAAQHRDAA